MIKILFLDNNSSDLANESSKYIDCIKLQLILSENVQEVWIPDEADVILIEEKSSYKNFRYIKELLSDPIVGQYLHKVFTINTDDCATGLLKGLYTSLPKSRFNNRLHVAIPYLIYPNELVLKPQRTLDNPQHLACWRGNTKSNAMRKSLVKQLSTHEGFAIETTDSWLNHELNEKQTYVDLILNAKFSLCPAGWAPVSFRIYESMALSRCPIIIADNFVPPTGPDWNKISVSYPENKLSSLPNFLSKIEHNYNNLGIASSRAWQSHFSPERMPHYLSQALLSLIQKTHPTNKQLEIKRWNSLHFYWSNKWTLPQRVSNKIRQLV